MFLLKASGDNSPLVFSFYSSCKILLYLFTADSNTVDGLTEFIFSEAL
jgi:hypothetical protein